MISPRPLVILQARMASSRLPGKALEPIAGRTLIGWCLDRLASAAAAPVLLATTTNREDDALEREASARGVPTFRGPAQDVLRRFCHAAASMGAEHLVRATADNPAVDVGAPARVLWILRVTGADYVAEHGLPSGAAVEGVRLSALQRADAAVSDPADREHVTMAIRRARDEFAVVEVAAPAELSRPDLRLTIDTEHDLRFMRAVLSQVYRGSGEPPLTAIISAADEVRAGGIVG